MTNERIAKEMIYPCWRGIPDDYKRKYARNIWEQFENNIRSAAYTSSLSKFFDTLRLKLDIEIATAHLAGIAEVLNVGEDRAILKALRDETTAIVLYVRLMNEEKKQDWKDRQEAKKQEEGEKAQNADLLI